MLKKSFMLSLVSVAALGFFSLPARADQTSVQLNNQEAAAVGEYNYIGQESSQISTQEQVGKYGVAEKYKTERQEAIQDAKQAAGAVGRGNRIRQTSEQLTIQQQNNSYRYHPSYRY
ncbi:hypothetical protein [Chroococcidiopsis sp. CCMEE 29]|uniref:hypothetical protein n=1 Tax=Chroococcidiopsis sp. CCMEE 29 TaxID=155894 RepID=UPI0020219CC6|nr:hypothetical protein [Chroococcidiopsis sp. CCMEE 29]